MDQGALDAMELMKLPPSHTPSIKLAQAKNKTHQILLTLAMNLKKGCLPKTYGP